MYAVRLKPVAHSSNRHRFVAIMAVALAILFILIWSSYYGAQSPTPQVVYTDGSSMIKTFVANQSRFNGIMIDAGSTGSRMHLYTFKTIKDGSIDLEGEVFEEISPGLSSFADDPKKAAESLRPMLEKAKTLIPEVQWASTLIALRATAGLRLLPKDKADALLKEVSDFLKTFPFKTGPDFVQIMDGVDEGKYIWMTLNFLLNVLNDPTKTFGTLDLGGGSTQITFIPTQSTITIAPPEYIVQVPIGNTQVDLYTHSYLGLGLMAARKSILEKSSPGSKIVSYCLPPDYSASWNFQGTDITVQGAATTADRFEMCSHHAVSILAADVRQPDEIKHRTFYAFSYYYDRAVDSGLIDVTNGGNATVQEFYNVAKLACNHPDVKQPFHCIDLTYITTLLHDGFGFDYSTMLLLKKKIKRVETAWTLGAMFQLLQENRSKSV